MIVPGKVYLFCSPHSFVAQTPFCKVKDAGLCHSSFDWLWFFYYYLSLLLKDVALVIVRTTPTYLYLAIINEEKHHKFIKCVNGRVGRRKKEGEWYKYIIAPRKKPKWLNINVFKFKLCSITARSSKFKNLIAKLLTTM